MVKMYSTKLKAEGFEVEVALDGDEGWKKAQEEGVSLILLDLMIPKMGGMDFLEKILTRKIDRLIDLNVEIIRYLINQLHIETEVILLSDLGIRAKGDLLNIEICKRLGASHFLAQGAAKKFLGEESFAKAGMQLKFFTPPSLIYPQLWGSFVPNLSTLDLILKCGPKSHDILFG